MVECDDGYGNLRLVRHYKPDAVLAEMQSPLRKVVALVDAQVIGGDNFEEAAQPKIDRYMPLANMMRDHLGTQSRVEVIPVIVGSCGVPPHNWSDVCARLRVKFSPAQLWKQVQQILIEHMYAQDLLGLVQPPELGEVNEPECSVAHCRLHAGWLYVT
jgi:hypothetical protein